MSLWGSPWGFGLLGVFLVWCLAMSRTKPIAAHPGYSISDTGVLKNPRGKPIKGSKHEGYLRAEFRINGKRERVFIHRLVLEAFVGPCPEGMECRHLDGDPTNNRLENLIWGTPRQNGFDRVRHRFAGCRKSKKSSLTGELVRSILVDARPYKAIAKSYGVSQGTISELKNGKSWALVWGDIEVVKLPGWKRKLGEEQIREILLSTESAPKLAQKFGVHMSSIENIRASNPMYHKKAIMKIKKEIV
jgi:hypothetical protein